MSTTVLAPSGLEISSSHESAESMMEVLSEPTKDRTPRVLRDKGVEVKPEAPKKDEETDDVSDAASKLGKRGGEAAARARKAAEKDEGKEKAEPEGKAAPAKEAKPAEDKGKAERGPDTEPEKAGAAEDDKEKPLGKPRSDPRARIAQLARERDEQKARADRAEREANEARRAPAREEREPERQPAAERATGKPKLADFLAKHDDYDQAVEEYTEAHAKWNREDWQRQSAEETRQRRTREYISGTVSTFQERITGVKAGDSKASESYGQFMSELPDALVSKLTTTFQLEDGAQVRGENIIADRLLKIDHPREVLEYFADNLDEFQRIAALQDPLEIAGEVAILSNRLDAATADTSSGREVSRAGTPPRSVGGSPQVAEPDLHSPQDFDTFMGKKKRAAR